MKLAVLILIALGILAAWGTIVESRFDAFTAQKVVYRSPYMYAVMVTLAVNLAAVMVDRWPWKKKHTGFVLAHIGIIVLMIGALVTSKIGIDGSLTLGIGESNQYVRSSETDLSVEGTMDGDKFALLYTKEVDFFSRRPDKKPLTIPLPDGEIKIVDYMPYALVDSKMALSQQESDGPAVRFQIQNSRVNVTDWISTETAERDAVRELGPARIILTADVAKTPHESGNAIILAPAKDGESVRYRIVRGREPGQVIEGIAKAGDSVSTGWMDLVFRVLKVLPHAKQEYSFQPQERPTPLTTEAIKVNFRGDERWMALNSLMRFFTDSTGYRLIYANRFIDLKFPLKLKDFQVGRYQGTMRAASYQSVVDVPDMGEVVISMNEPLKYKGFTFYQASFQQDDSGQPTASVLSVNRDPGRFLKYLGSLLIVLGAIHMFYFKKRGSKTAPAVS